MYEGHQCYTLTSIDIKVIRQAQYRYIEDVVSSVEGVYVMHIMSFVVY